MRSTRAFAVLGAWVVAFGLVAGTVSAGTGGAPASPSQRWHAPARLSVIDNRLKHADVARVQPQLSRWRSAREATEVGVRRNAWRVGAIIRPRHAPRTQAASTAQSFDEALVAAINQVRARHGLPTLRWSGRLEDAAQLHSRNMGRRGFFAHESADGTEFWKRVEQFYSSRGFGYWAVGENLIWASPELDVNEAVQGWMNSPGHRANILSREWRELGLASVRLDSAPGVYGGRKVTIVTCDFGVRR